MESQPGPARPRPRVRRPPQADDELDLAEQLLAGLDLRATTINAAIASLNRDAGSPAVEDRARTLRTELDVAGLTSMTPTLEVATAFHQAVLDDHEALNATIARLREQTSDGTYAYYTDIAHFMADLPLPPDHTPPRWLDDEEATRARWRAIVTARRDLLPPGAVATEAEICLATDRLPDRG
ncbi:hypothetical protein ACFTY8_36280 [Streptomyces mirabilis]|uniref:hypothetical protein n=1 Tax=Streptomyces mirabilis TaxID=68239 RepID=UPI003625C850